MKTVRAILFGAVIWLLGVMAFSFSFYVPLMDDVELQANLTLFFAVIPIVWYGNMLYHLNDNKTHGFKVGLTFFLTAAVLDALITVPILIIPFGGSYYEFFTDIGFWCIGLEFITVSMGYWYLKVFKKHRII